MICDPDYWPGVTTWSDITETNKYVKDLRQSVVSLENWAKDFGGKGFRARLTELVAITATFVDPESEDGRLFLLLNTWQQRSGQKARFLVTNADHYEIFYNYWENYRLAFLRAKPIE
jgi:hypothetical protein